MDGLGVSVIITTYNRAELLIRALHCVLGQVRPHDEIIVVDDGSTDDTEMVLLPYMERIRYIKKSNSGQRSAINLAFQEATKDLVAILDDDDVWLPNKLELQRQVMELHPEALYSYTSYTRAFPDGTEETGCLFRDVPAFQAWKRDNTPVPFSFLADLPEGQNDFGVIVGNDYATHMRTDFILGSLVMVRRKAAGALLRYPEGVDYCWDWEFCARLSKVGPVAYLDCDLYRRYQDSSIRPVDRDVIGSTKSRLRSLQRIWGQDQEFLKDFGEEYQKRIDTVRNRLVSGLLVGGDVQGAKRELALIKTGSPSSYRFLATLPAFAVTGILSARRSFRRFYKG